MLLGTFQTVFNSVFLVPTKTNTLHHKATAERQESWETDSGECSETNTSKEGMFLNIIFMHFW